MRVERVRLHVYGISIFILALLYPLAKSSTDNDVILVVIFGGTFMLLNGLSNSLANFIVKLNNSKKSNHN